MASTHYDFVVVGSEFRLALMDCLCLSREGNGSKTYSLQADQRAARSRPGWRNRPENRR